MPSISSTTKLMHMHVHEKERQRWQRDVDLPIHPARVAYNQRRNEIWTELNESGGAFHMISNANALHICDTIEKLWQELEGTIVRFLPKLNVRPARQRFKWRCRDGQERELTFAGERLMWTRLYIIFLALRGSANDLRRALTLHTHHMYQLLLRTLSEEERAAIPDFSDVTFFGDNAALQMLWWRRQAVSVVANDAVVRRRCYIAACAVRDHGFMNSVALYLLWRECTLQAFQKSADDHTAGDTKLLSESELTMSELKKSTADASLLALVDYLQDKHDAQYKQMFVTLPSFWTKFATQEQEVAWSGLQQQISMMHLFTCDNDFLV